MEAIILAGGLGTRLRSEVKDVPKAMALIQGRPFMEYLLDHLISEGVTKIIFSVGHKSEIIQDHFANQYRDCEIVYAVETTLLGTGGAIKNAMQFATEEHVIVVNGDSLFIADLKAQYMAHTAQKAAVTLALNAMRNIERYGTVDLDENQRITQFNEKQPLEKGIINAGVYIFDVAQFRAVDFPEKFSIEKEFFETHLENLHFHGHTTQGYFLDIGIPKDFKKAQYEIGLFPTIDTSWTLFLDRDGVINKKLEADYVKSLDELEILPGAIEAIVDFSQLFGRIIIVTNQQGVGKKLMTEVDLTEIHQHIRQQVEEAGGRIDAIYHAPQLVAENSPMRKPEIGMALQAQKDFPDIDFSKSIMVGDSASDMEFASRAKMPAVFIGSPNTDYPYTISSLVELNKMLKSIL